MPRRRFQTNNPLAAILGAIGGGFEGYAAERDKRGAAAERARVQQREDDEFGLQQQRHEDLLSQQALENMVAQHESDTRAAKEFQDAKAAEARKTRLEGAGPAALRGDVKSRSVFLSEGERDPYERPPLGRESGRPTEPEQEQLGLAYLANADDAFRAKVKTMIASNIPLYTRKPGLAAWRVAYAMQNPAVDLDKYNSPLGAAFTPTPFSAGGQSTNPNERIGPDGKKQYRMGNSWFTPPN